MKSHAIGSRGLRAAGLALTFALATACSGSAATPTPSPSATGSGEIRTLPPPASASLSPAPILTSAPITYSPPPPSTPTPTVAPGMWRWEGVVVDADEKPVEGVCIVIGPNGCQPTNPRTDARGAWFVDFPQAPVQYDLHFTKEGYATYSARVTPTANWTFNVVLQRG